MREYTLKDPDVARFLNDRFVTVWVNQIPGLYCASHSPTNKFPIEMVDKCPEGAGGGNVRIFVCSADGKLESVLMGYWKKETFLRELEPHGEHHSGGSRQENLLRHCHEYAWTHRGRDIEPLLRQIEDEAYTKGKVG